MCVCSMAVLTKTHGTHGDRETAYSNSVAFQWLPRTVDTVTIWTWVKYVPMHIIIHTLYPLLFVREPETECLALHLIVNKPIYHTQ